MVLTDRNNQIRAIEILYEEQSQPWFKRADLGRCLGVVKVKNSMHIPPHFMCKRQDIEGNCCTVPLGRVKNPHDVFVNLDGAIYIATNSKKEKAAALISWLVKKGVEKLQEEHQTANDKIKELKDKHDWAIEDMTRRIEAIQLESGETKQKLRLNLHQHYGNQMVNSKAKT